MYDEIAKAPQDLSHLSTQIIDILTPVPAWGCLWPQSTLPGVRVPPSLVSLSEFPQLLVHNYPSSRALWAGHLSHILLSPSIPHCDWGPAAHMQSVGNVHLIDFSPFSVSLPHPLVVIPGIASEISAVESFSSVQFSSVAQSCPTLCDRAAQTKCSCGVLCRASGTQVPSILLLHHPSHPTRVLSSSTWSKLVYYEYIHFLIPENK